MATARERKRAVSIRSDLNLELNTIRFWAWDYNKEAPLPGYDFRVEVNKVNPALYPYAILDGIKDSVRDAGALGADASLRQKFDAMKERAEYLESGADNWSRGGRGEGEGTLLFKALMREKPSRDEAKTAAYVKALPRGTRDKMLASDRLADIVRDLRAESGKNVDLTDTWAELEALDSDEQQDEAAAGENGAEGSEDEDEDEDSEEAEEGTQSAE